MWNFILIFRSSMQTYNWIHRVSQRTSLNRQHDLNSVKIHTTIVELSEDSSLDSFSQVMRVRVFRTLTALNNSLTELHLLI